MPAGSGINSLYHCVPCEKVPNILQIKQKNFKICNWIKRIATMKGKMYIKK